MSRKPTLALAISLLVFSVTGLLVPLPNQYRSTWVAKLLDVGHLPLFFVIMLCFWRIVGRRLWLGFVLAAALAVAAEIGQEFTDRSGDPLDVVRGMLGASIAVVWLQVWAGPRTWRQIAARLALSLALAAWPVWDSGPTLLDAYWSYRAFPVLSDFRSPWEPLRWYTSGSALGRECADSCVGRLDVTPLEGGAILFPIIQDWSSYRRLVCRFSFSGEPLRILISVRDGKKVQPPRRRFDLEQDYAAGQHQVVIDLAELRAGQDFAPLDLSRIQSFHIVVKGLSEQRTVILERIWLE